MMRKYRKLQTKRGVYFVAWRPDEVLQLIITEGLVPADFHSVKKHEMHKLVRDLYLLACKGSLDSCIMNNSNDSVLAKYARKLQSTINTMH